MNEKDGQEAKKFKEQKDKMEKDLVKLQ